MKNLRNILSPIAAILLTSLSSRAVTETPVSVIETSSSNVETTYDGNIDKTDSLLTGAVITSNGVSPDYGSSYSGLNDGLVSDNGGATASSAPNNLYLDNNVTNQGDLNNDLVVTFTLNTSVGSGSPLGYTLTSINSIYGWQNYPSMSDQSYTVSYTTVTDSTFTLLATVNYAPFDPAITSQDQDSAASQVTLTDLGNITGVNAIQFAFTPYVSSGGDEQNGQMIREIDVFGSAVPEPSPWVMLLGGVGMLLVVRRSRDKLSL